MMTELANADAEPRLLIVAESLLSRAGLAALLEERGCNVLGQADGAGMRRAIERLEPDLLIVDFGWETETLRDRLIPLDKDIPVLALAHDDELALRSVLGALRAFPRFALLLRESDPDGIVAAVTALDEGLTVLDPRLIDLFDEALPSERTPPANPLTARENEVLQLLARGLTNRAIAHELGISQHTAKFHVNAIMSKLDAQSRTEAVVRATRLGMIVL
ncbi:MAG: response regulator transcription factor [Chloroflexota bacterium]|nr:response regulator transcription factor [Chloroflexota bacterium]MDE2947412.1 response regulator transcription factor [Chloroflexota bacterium]